MADQGYPSKRHRGGDQPRRKARSHGQPPAASTSSPTIDPTLTQDYSVTPEPLTQIECWGNGSMAMDWEHDGSDRFGSASSPTTTYLPSETTTEGLIGTAGGYVMVQSRSSGAYSNGSGSNLTSEEASEQGQQAYYSPPWTPGAEFVVDQEGMQADSIGPPTHLQQWSLPSPAAQSELHPLDSLPRMAPQTGNPKLFMYNPYQKQATSSNPLYEEYSNNYTLHRTYQTSATESSFQSPKAQGQFSPPWNQTDLRNPRYQPSDVAWGLSPEPEIHSSPRKPRSQTKKSSNRSPKIAPGPGKEKKPKSPEWEHIVVEKGGLKIVSEGKYGDTGHGSGGRRKGELGKEAKEKAARIRKMKACWNCWILKVPCSEGEVCERCIKFCSKKSPSADQLCSRAGFIDFEDTFFPEYLHCHFQKREFDKFLNEHSGGFIDNGIEVEVGTGSVFAPLRLTTHFFKPKHGWESELLKQHHLTFNTEEQQSKFLCRYSAPVGLMASSKSDLKRTLREHIEQMLANRQYSQQTTAGDLTNVPFLILEAVKQYSMSTDSSLVRNALMLHAMHYFMRSLITFTEESASNVYELSPHYNVPPEPFLSSRLLNRQLKVVMHRLHRDVTRELLEGLEKSMRSRTKDAWGPSFAAILVLCLCIEGLQTAADTFVVCDRIKEGENSAYRREHSRAACEAVEENPYEKCTRLFHDIFKTKKEGNGGAREGGFNPLKAMQNETETGLDPATEQLVQSIYYMVYNAHADLQILSEQDTLLHYGCDVDPQDIKINNTGRLVAKFLMSFFAKES